MSGLSHYPKVECSYETFHKPKWCKAKKQLPLIYMENFLSVPRPQIQGTHNIVFILSTMIRTLSYIQFYVQRNALTSSSRLL